MVLVPSREMKLLLVLAVVVCLPSPESGTFLLLLLTAAVSFKEQCLRAHNRYRKLHQVGNVTWSDKMEQIATDWANYLAENNLFKHSSKRPGNLFMAPYKPREYCTEALKWMYTEEKLYNYSRPGYQPRAGHFTQIIWKNTKEIGAAWAFRKDGKLVVVIKYNPMGNFASANAFRANVFPPLQPTTTAPTIIASTTTAPKTTAPKTTSPTSNEPVTSEPVTDRSTTDERRIVVAGNPPITASLLPWMGSLLVVLFRNVVV